MQTCIPCNGTGQVDRQRSVQDTTMSLALGAAFGSGWFPSYKIEHYKETCYGCFGRGRK